MMGVNVKELVEKAGNKNSWKIRLEAINKLKNIDCEERKDVIKRLAFHDRVYRVMQEAFKIAQSLGYKGKNGKPLYLGKKDIGYNAGDFKKYFIRIKKECKMEILDLQVFKDKFITVKPEMYDVMLYEKGDKFNDWIEKIYMSLPENK